MPWSFYDKNGNLKQAAASVVRPIARLSAAASQSVTNSTLTTMTLATTDIDTNSMTGTANTLTIKTAGNYRLNGRIRWAGGGVGSGREVDILKNGVIVTAQRAPFNGTYEVTAIAEKIIPCVAGDAITLQGWHDSTAAFSTSATFIDTFLEAEFVDGAVAQPVAYPASLVGQEVAYAEATTDINSTAATSATAVAFVTAPAFTADGVSAYRIEVSAPAMESTAGGVAGVILYDGSTELGWLSRTYMSTSGVFYSIRNTRRLVPAAGSHTYSARIYMVSGTANVTVHGGTGASGAWVPASIRVTKAT